MADHIFTNCPRYIPKMVFEESSVYTRPARGTRRRTPPGNQDRLLKTSSRRSESVQADLKWESVLKIGADPDSNKEFAAMADNALSGLQGVSRPSPTILSTANNGTRPAVCTENSNPNILVMIAAENSL